MLPHHELASPRILALLHELNYNECPQGNSCNSVAIHCVFSLTENTHTGEAFSAHAPKHNRRLSSSKKRLLMTTDFCDILRTEIRNPKEETVMSSSNIGKNIAELRKKHEVTQDALAKKVGVSAQAVSKWENGGDPDAMLLPVIADFFHITIDSLFGRNDKDSAYVQNVIMDYLTVSESSERVERAFDLCWDMERVLVMGEKTTWGGTIADMQEFIGEGKQSYSSMMNDYGFTRMGLGTKSKYFLLVPEVEDEGEAYIDGVDYESFFRELSDKTFLDTLFMLYQRDSEKIFNDELLMHAIGITAEKAEEMIGLLDKYKLLKPVEIELGDQVQKAFRFVPNPAFVGLLIFAKEMIAPPCNNCFRLRERKKPYLK